ncbi:P-loop NTPase fold protein, partial [Cytobacillus firmus]
MPILKKISALSKPMSEKVISQLKYPDYRNLLGTREQVKEHLDVLIQAWVKKREDKIVIMVDELDRCSAGTIVEFFEALQLFLPVESIIHVITINQEAVCYALANSNMHFFDTEIVSNKDKLAFGKEYLEKYITISYQLPHSQNLENYINHLLIDQSENDLNYIFRDSEKKALVEIITEINNSRRINPRELKKII